MKFITKQEFDELLAKDSYWNGRWGYTNEVIKILEQENITSALEIGTKELQVVKGSHIMDLDKENDCEYHWNAGITPWPINDKDYDVLIALQVWEHLRDNQQTAFLEAIRTCKMAILSFPLMWDCPNDPMHHGISTEKIKEWTCGVEPEKIIPIINSTGPNSRNRIIYFFKF